MNKRINKMKEIWKERINTIVKKEPKFSHWFIICFAFFFLLNVFGMCAIGFKFCLYSDDFAISTIDDTVEGYTLIVANEYAILSKNDHLLGLLQERIYVNDTTVSSNINVLYRWELLTKYYKYRDRNVSIIESMMITFRNPVLYSTDISSDPPNELFANIGDPEGEIIDPIFEYRNSQKSTVIEYNQDALKPDNWNSTTYNYLLLFQGSYLVRNKDDSYECFLENNVYRRLYNLDGNDLGITLENNLRYYDLGIDFTLRQSRMRYGITLMFVIIVITLISIIFSADFRRNWGDHPPYIKNPESEANDESERYINHVQYSNIIFLLTLTCSTFTILSYYWASNIFIPFHLRRFISPSAALTIVFILIYISFYASSAIIKLDILSKLEDKVAAEFISKVTKYYSVSAKEIITLIATLFALLLFFLNSSSIDLGIKL